MEEESVILIEFNYDELSTRIKNEMHAIFPKNTCIATQKGSNRVQVLMVSSLFDDMSESKKQDMVHEILQEKLDPDLYKAISMIVVYGSDEL